MHIIFHDEQLIIVNKPAGLLSVPGKGDDKCDCLITRLQTQFPDALTVHRLDQATSGVMVFARGKWAQSRLSYQFIKRLTVKHYEALVQGIVLQDDGEINLPVAADWPNRPRQKVDHQKGKHALTHWQVLQRDESRRITKLQLMPHTGRTHQLRVHMAAMGHPIVGDVLYGAAAAERVYLHASSLQVNHPITMKVLDFHCAAEF